LAGVDWRAPAFTAGPASLGSFLKKENATTFYRCPILYSRSQILQAPTRTTRFWHPQPLRHLVKGPETSNPFRRGKVAFNGAAGDTVALDTVFE
jgi:hypothetical protein